MVPQRDTCRRAFLGSFGAAIVGIAGCTTAGENPFSTTESGGSNNTGVGGSPGSPSGTGTAGGTPTGDGTGGDPDTSPEPPSGSGEPDQWTGLDRGVPFESFDAFDDQWYSVGGSAAPSEDIAYGGGRSVYLATDGSKRVRIRRRFDSVKDFSDTGFSMAVRLEGTTQDLIRPVLILEDLFGNQRLLSGSVRAEANSRWVRLDLGVQEDKGIDMGAVKQLDIHLWDDDDVSRFYVDDIRTHDLPEKGYVMFTFDDSDPRDYSVAFPVLEEHGFQGAFFPHVNNMTNGFGPSVENYLEIQDHGWDIGGHTLDHEDLARYTAREQRLILERNKEWLVDNGFTHGARFFRTPYGSYDTNSLDLMPEYFDVSFIGAGTAKGVNFEVTDPRTVGFRGGDDYERAKGFIDAAADFKQLLGLTLHMSNMDNREAFEDLIAHAARRVNQGRLEVITPSTLLDEHIRG